MLQKGYIYHYHLTKIDIIAILLQRNKQTRHYYQWMYRKMIVGKSKKALKSAPFCRLPCN